MAVGAVWGNYEESNEGSYRATAGLIMAILAPGLHPMLYQCYVNDILVWEWNGVDGVVISPFTTEGASAQDTIHFEAIYDQTTKDNIIPRT